MTDCPNCGTEMEPHSASGIGPRGIEVGVTWDTCPDCKTVVDEYDNVIEP